MFKIIQENCTGCGACVRVCPVDVISMVNGKAQIDGERCIDCGRCASVCPVGAVSAGDSNTDGNIHGNQGSPFPGFGAGRGMGHGMGRGLGKGQGRGRGGKGR